METIAESTRVLYTARTHTIGGREHGLSRSYDGHLNVKLSTPGLDGGTGTNPEQLIAAGWSASFEGAMDITARKRFMTLSEKTAVDAEVDLCFEKGEYFLQGRLHVSLPGIDTELAHQIINAARRICPYTKALESTVHVEFNLV